MKSKFVKILRFAPVLGLFSLVSCAGNGQPLTEVEGGSAPAAVQKTQEGSPSTQEDQRYFESYSSTPAPSKPRTSSTNAESSQAYDESFESSEAANQSVKELKASHFSFNPPKEGWTLIGGTPEYFESGTPYEFYNPTTGRRAVLQETELPKGEPHQLMDRALLEMKGFENSGKKASKAQTYPENALGRTGVFFDIVSKRYDTPYEAVGFVLGAGNHVFTLTLSANDVQLADGALKKEWQEFFESFKVIVSEKENGPTLSAENVTEHRSEVLGYHWSTKDTLWHHWLEVSDQNKDPDLILSNKSEELSLSIYGVNISSDIVTQQDMFNVLLVRQGIDPSDPSMTSKRIKIGDYSAQEFTIKRRVGKFELFYKGRFVYDNGRGLMILTQTQALDLSKYEKYMNKALEGFVVDEVSSDKLGDERLNEFSAAIINQVGIQYLMADQPLIALSYFEQANKMVPDEPLYLANCGFVYMAKKLYGPGIRHFEGQMDLVRKNGRLLYILAEMYEEIFDFASERECIEAALRYTPNDPDYVITLSDALWGLGQRNQSLLVVQRLYDTQPSAYLGVYLAKTYMGLNQYSEAVDLLYEMRGRFGMDAELGQALMLGLMTLGRYQEAQSIGEETLSKERNNDKIWTLQGKILFYAKNYREAEKVLNKAISLKENNEEAKSFLSATKAFLGKADNKTLQKPITPVEEKATDLKALIRPEIKTEAVEGDFPAVIHYRKDALRSDKGDYWTRTEEMLVEILDVRGSSLYQEFTFDYLPGFDRIYMNALEVYDSTFKLKQKYNLNNTYITYATELAGGNESQTAHYNLQDVKPGDFIYLQYSRTSLEKTDVIPYTNYISSKDVPIGESVFRIYADTSRFFIEEYGMLERKDFDGGIEWSIQDPEVVRNELYMPIYYDFGSGVMLTGKQKWEEIGENYENMIKHQYKQAVAVREKAFEVKGTKDGNNAVKVIANFVRDHIQYRDIRFGGHSLIPQTAEVTLKEHRGDCKDMALLIKEMLTAVGIKSHLAAIHLTEDGFEHLPTIQQFNHLILYVPKQGNISETWIDATDKVGNDRPIPLDLEGKTSLIIDGANSHIVTTPILEDNQKHSVDIDHKLYLGKEGNCEFRDSVTLQGKFAGIMRNTFYGRDSKEQQQLMEEFLSKGIPDASLSNLKIINLYDFNKPLILISIYSTKNYFGKAGELKGRFPNVWERSMFQLPKVNKRHHPLRIPTEVEFSYNLFVKSSDGKEISITRPAPFPRKTDYVEYEKTKTGIKWTTYALYADASEYERIREEWNYLLSETSPLITAK